MTRERSKARPFITFRSSITVRPLQLVGSCAHRDGSTGARTSLPATSSGRGFPHSVQPRRGAIAPGLDANARVAPNKHDTGGALRVLVVSVALALMAVAILTSSASAALKSASPVDPDTGFPAFYTDSNGLALQPCLDGLPNCLAARAGLIDAHLAGGDGEAFYYSADADVGPINVHNALEAAYAADGPDQE